MDYLRVEIRWSIRPDSGKERYYGITTGLLESLTPNNVTIVDTQGINIPSPNGREIIPLHSEEDSVTLGLSYIDSIQIIKGKWTN
jgi:hypothetical protein